MYWFASGMAQRVYGSEQSAKVIVAARRAASLLWTGLISLCSDIHPLRERTQPGKDGLTHQQCRLPRSHTRFGSLLPIDARTLPAAVTVGEQTPRCRALAIPGHNETAGEASD
jgi:hypothetical protein